MVARRVLILAALLSWTFPAQAVVVDLAAVADSYIQGNAVASNFGASNLLKVKNGDDTPIFSRKSYLRFDLATLPPAIKEASLNVAFIESGEGTNGTTVNWTFEVFGLVDGHAGENWDESTINWTNAPANNTTDGNGFLAGAASLGTFSFTGRTASLNFTGNSGTALRNFLAQSTSNDLVTLMIVRNTLDPGTDNYVHAIASSEHSVASLHPYLNVTAVPEPSPLLLIGLLTPALLTRPTSRRARPFPLR